MREVLFRGKRDKKYCPAEDWTYGVPYIDNEGDWMMVDDCSRRVVQPETIGQYTGLTDKNGKKIFEGDIVESRASENKEDWKRWIVTFYDGSFCFERELPRKRKHKYEQNLLCEDEIKLYHLTVIGNIHDNPELLKGGAE